MREKTSREKYESVAFNSRPACHSDDTPKSLTPDQMAVLKNALPECYQAARFVQEMAEKGKLTVSIASNGMGVAIAQLMEAAKAVGHDAVMDADRESTLVAVRAANERIRDLEKQLAGGVSAEAFQAFAGEIVNGIFTKWRDAGFSYGKGNLGGRYLELELSLTADDGISTFSETPVSDKQTATTKKQALESRGIVFLGERHHEQAADTDACKAAIAELILEVWPDAKITKWESGYGSFGSTRDFVLRHVNVLVPIESLEVGTKALG